MYNKSPPRLPPNVIIKEEITEDVLSSMKNVRNDYKDSEYNDNNGHDESSDSKMRLHSAFLSNYNSRYFIHLIDHLLAASFSSYYYLYINLTFGYRCSFIITQSQHDVIFFCFFSPSCFG